MGVCVRRVWLDSDMRGERPTSSSESSKLLREAEQRAVEHARRIANRACMDSTRNRATNFWPILNGAVTACT